MSDTPPEQPSPPPSGGWSQPPPPGGWQQPPPQAPTQFESNYYRGPLGRSFFRPPGVYWDSLQVAFDMLRSDWGTYALGTLILGGATLLIGMVASGATILGVFSKGVPGPGQALTLPLWAYAIQVVQQVVANVFILCLISLGVGQVKRGTAAMADFFLPFRRAANTFVASLVLSLPGIFWICLNMVTQHDLARDSFSTPVIGAYLFTLFLAILWLLFAQGPLLLGSIAASISERAPLESFSVAYKRMGWNAAMFGLLYFVATLASGLGLVACCIGVIFTYALSTNVVALHYTYYFPEDMPEQPEQFPPAPATG